MDLNFESKYKEWINRMEELVKDAKMAASSCDVNRSLFLYGLAEWLREAGAPRARTSEEFAKLGQGYDKTINIINEARREIVKILKEKCGCKVKGG